MMVTHTRTDLLAGKAMNNAIQVRNPSGAKRVRAALKVDFHAGRELAYG